MNININLSEELTKDLNTGNMKTVKAITHILSSVNSSIYSIKTDIQELNKVALKDLYIIDPVNKEKYHCFNAQVDNELKRFVLSF